MRFELAMRGEDIGRLTGISRSRTERPSRVERAQMLLAYREKPSFLRGGEKAGCIIRRCNAASNGRWPIAHLRHSMTDRGRSRRSRRKPRPRWCRWRATRPRSTAMRTNCDDTAFRPPWRRARTGGGHECLARLVQHGRRNFFAVRTALASGDSTSIASAVVTTSSPRRALGGRARHRAVTVGATKAVKLHKVMRATMDPSVMKLAPTTVGGTAMPSVLAA